MVGNNKVVHIAGSSGQGSAKMGEQAKAHVKMVQKVAEQGLTRLLQTLFDQADDALFERADRSASNVDQTRYFDAMREIRIKRQGMETGVLRTVSGAMDELCGQGVLPADIAQLGELSVDTLALVEREELEERVAVDAMVKKAESSHKRPLLEFTTRLDSLVSGQTVTEKTNPVGPAVLSDAFLEACRGIEIDIKAKLVLLKLFDRHVLFALGKMYDLCNKLLVDKGVIPDLNVDKEKPVASKRAPKTPAQSPGEVPVLTETAQAVNDEDVYAGLQTLVQRTAPATAGGGLVAPGQAPQIPRQNLLQLLQQLQLAQMTRLQEQQEQALQGVTPQQINVVETLGGLLQTNLPNTALSLGQLEHDVINLVEMLFQFVLDERNLAAPMKALVARLQLPILKLAMQDKTFFSKGNHPARQLLNEISSAAVGWSPTDRVDRDPLYKTVDQLVDRVVNDFETEVGIFDEVIADLRDYLAKEQKRAELVARRTLDAEDGKAKAEVAKQRVQALLDDKVVGAELPKPVIKLLEEGWSQVLFLVGLKNGEDSDQWREAVQTLDDLLWSVQPLTSDEERQQLIKAVPPLMKSLRAGLRKVSYNPFDMQQLFEALEAIHLNQLEAPDSTKHVAAETVAEQQEEGLDAQAEALVKPMIAEVQSGNQTLDQALDQRAEDNATLESLDAELSDSLGDLDALLDDDAQLAPQSAPPASPAKAAPADEPATEVVAEEPELADDDPVFATVDALAMGSWLEMHQGSDKKYRCRLAAIIRSTGKYIFVNRTGMKVAEYGRSGLAAALKSGELSTLDDGMLFDRALESVIGDLRGKKSFKS